MTTRKVRAGMPAPDDIPWPEPEPEEDGMEETQERVLGLVVITAVTFVISILYLVFVW